MKFKLNRAFREASGELDGLVYRNVRGQVVASRKPDTSNVIYSESQIAHRERFKQAAAYGKAALAEPAVRALYEAVAKEKDMPVFALTIADFFNAPVIDSLDLSGYTGQPGSLIHISARDDFGVMRVHVTIANDNNDPIENGEATSLGGGWVYTTTATITTGTTVAVNVVATDRPGGTGVSSGTKSF